MSRQKGFTLIELMVVVAIVAILAMIAMPSFTEQIRKSRRSVAMQALSDLQLKQERWRANNITYGSLTDIGGAALTPDGYYALSVATPSGTCSDGKTPLTNKNSYAITADTKGAQESDDGRCATLVLTSRCGIVEKTSTPSGGTCW